MLQGAKVYAMLPASDLPRAQAFYADKLGMTPTEDEPGGLLYACAGGTAFVLFASSGKASGDHTQVGWEVADLEAEVQAMRSLGVVFEEYDMPGLKTVGGIAEGPTERGAWFRDSEGNLLSLIQRA